VTTENPFLGPYSARTQISPDPLARVLVQLVFQPLFVISTTDGLAKFQDAIRSRFPSVQMMKQVIEMGTTDDHRKEQAPHDTVTGIIYQFISMNSTSRLTIADTALTLETAHYLNREDFLSDLKFILGHFFRDYSPTVTRMGYRYINRISAFEGEKLVTPSLINPDLLGLHELFPDNLPQRELSQARFSTPEGVANLVWGHTDPNYMRDEEILNPTNIKAWLLDIDVMTNKDDLRLSCDENSIDIIVNQINNLADRGRTIFNWCVTQNFLDRFKKEEN
jgi:uncharacterized protein (TIGR04255 family)